MHFEMCFIHGVYIFSSLLSHTHRNISPSHRPSLYNYWQHQALARPSVSSTVDVLTAVRNYFILTAVKKLAGGLVLAAGVAAGAVLVSSLTRS